METVPLMGLRAAFSLAHQEIKTVKLLWIAGCINLKALLERFRLIADALIILLSLWLSLQARGFSWSGIYVTGGIVSAITFLLIAQSNGVYRSWRAASFGQMISAIVLSWALTMFVLLFLAYAAKSTSQFSRIAISSWMIVSPMLLIIWRFSARKLLDWARMHGHNVRSVAIAGATTKGNDLAQLIQEHPSVR